MLLLLIVAGGGLAILRARGPEIAAVAARRRSLEQHLVASGRVEAPARVPIASSVDGRVRAVLVDVGATIGAGDVLAELEDETARADVAQAEASLAQAEARLRQLRGVAAVQASQGRARAEVDLERAERQASRARELAASGGLPAAELEEAERTLRAARASLEEARARELGSGARGADTALAVAGVDQARAQLVAARARLGQRRIVAPVAGVILTRSVELGQVIAPGAALFTLAASGPSHLVFETDERNLGLVAVGQSARAATAAYPREAFDAVVDRVAPSIDAQRGTVQVRLSMPAPPATLRPDMTVSVDVRVGRADAALVIPATAVRQATSLAPWVWIVRAGRAARRDVRLGIRGDDLVEVREGLAEGELVLVPGERVLVVGDKVRPRVEPPR